MNPRNAAEIALGVAGTWMIVSRIPELGLSLIFALRGPNGSLGWHAVYLGLVVACGLGLVLLRRPIASWLVPVAQPDLTGPIAGLQAAAYSVVGVLLLARGLSGLFGELAGPDPDTRLSSFSEFGMPLAQIGVGLALFLGARGLVTIWQSLRTAGVPSAHRDDGGAA